VPGLTPIRRAVTLTWLAGAAVQASPADGWAWQTPAEDSAPTNRSFLSAVWTGSEVLFWGGQVHDGRY